MLVLDLQLKFKNNLFDTNNKLFIKLIIIKILLFPKIVYKLKNCNLKMQTFIINFNSLNLQNNRRHYY